MVALAHYNSNLCMYGAGQVAGFVSFASFPYREGDNILV